MSKLSKIRITLVVIYVLRLVVSLGKEFLTCQTVLYGGNLRPTLLVLCAGGVGIVQEFRLINVKN